MLALEQLSVNDQSGVIRKNPLQSSTKLVSFIVREDFDRD